MSLSVSERPRLRSSSSVAQQPFKLMPGSGCRREPLPCHAPPLAQSLRVAYDLRPTQGDRFDKNRWLHDFEKLSDDEIDDAIVVVLDKLDQWLERRQIEYCVDILNLADPERIPIEISLALLSGTLPARQELLVARRQFLARFETRLRREMPGDVDLMLRGLR